MNRTGSIPFFTSADSSRSGRAFLRAAEPRQGQVLQGSARVSGDQLFGDDGNDTLVVCLGDDHLEGGATNGIGLAVDSPCTFRNEEIPLTSCQPGANLLGL